MIDANAFWLMMLCILGSILLVILIILGIKLIITVDKFNDVMEDVSNKVSKFNNMFSAVDVVADSLVGISDKIVEFIAESFKKVFSKKRKREEEIENEKE